MRPDRPKDSHRPDRFLGSVVDGYLALKWVHVMSAAYLVGAIVTEGLLAAYARRAGHPSARRLVWEFLVKGEEKVAIPIALVLLASGLLMVYGPFAGGWSVTRDLWVGAGIVLFVVLLVLMAGLGGAAAKAALAAHEHGDAGATAAAHERRYLIILGVGFVLAALVVWLMVTKPA